MTRLLRACAWRCRWSRSAPPPHSPTSRPATGRRFKFEGMLGRMVGMFGGKAAKEGVETTTAVKGDRKATTTDTTGRIVDLSEEKVYDIDVKKKTYTVTTFDELRRRMREARRRRRRTRPRSSRPRSRSEKPQEKPTKEDRGRLRREGDRPEEAARRLRRARDRDDDHRPRERARRSRRPAASS